MKVCRVWIILLIQICCTARSYPTNYQQHLENKPLAETHKRDLSKDSAVNNDNGEVISVRITSSVAVGRVKGRNGRRPTTDTKLKSVNSTNLESFTEIPNNVAASEKIVVTDIPPDLIGANIEFIKQLNAKKEARALHNVEQIHPFQSNSRSHQNFTEFTSTEEPTNPISVLSFVNTQNEGSNDNIPIARSISFVPKDLVNYNQGYTKPPNILNNRPRLTTVNFNIVHDNSRNPNYRDQSQYNPTPDQSQSFYNEPSKIYSEPAKIYSEPAKFYGEPAKIYSEPAKIYSEPAKVYSEPAKIYSEPAKFYSEPASLYLQETNWNNKPTNPSPTPIVTTSTMTDEITNIRNNDPDHIPESNYEVEEKVNLMSNGKSHGVQETTTEHGKVGYVLEGKQFRKYRVEERTSDGFIVGEYGVVRNEDGDLRGVRYTADGEASPRLIYDALMKFLQLK